MSFLHLPGCVQSPKLLGFSVFILPYMFIPRFHFYFCWAGGPTVLSLMGEIYIVKPNTWGRYLTQAWKFPTLKQLTQTPDVQRVKRTCNMNYGQWPMSAIHHGYEHLKASREQWVSNRHLPLKSTSWQTFEWLTLLCQTIQKNIYRASPSDFAYSKTLPMSSTGKH